MNYIGLDLSLTGTGVVVLDDNGKVLESDRFGYKRKRDDSQYKKIERLVYIAHKVVDIAGRHLDFRLGIENYAYNAKGAQNDLGEVHGVVKVQLFIAFDAVPDMIAVSSARKKALGKGRFKSKSDIINAVNERGFLTSDDNVADAYVIAECLRLTDKEMKDGH